MNALDLLNDRESLYWVLGILVPLLVILAVFLFRRASRKATPHLNRAPDRAPHESITTGSAAVSDPSSLRSAQDVPLPVAPSNRSIPAIDDPEGRLVGDDVPDDLAARPLGALESDLATMAHTVEEIQRKEPKALSDALTNTRTSFFGRIRNLFGSQPALTSDEMDGLEEILYTSDLGPQTVQRLLEAVENKVKLKGSSGFEAVRTALKTEMLEIFEDLDSANEATPNGSGNGAGNGVGSSVGNGHASSSNVIQMVAPGSEPYMEGLERLAIWDHRPAVMMIVGVNGAGKTTTIGKLARRLAQSGRKVLVAAGDTFRAAAGDQLKVWTERAQVEIFSPEGVTDPSAAAFMACERAQSHGFDIVIVDTAGRLHTQKNLMEELKKMKRVIAKQITSAPHETLLVLDANSGQNALIQAREFHQALDVTGVVLTKLDGTAKGGVAIGLAHELRIPIKLIGVGEGIDDLRRFSSQEFVDSII